MITRDELKGLRDSIGKGVQKKAEVSVISQNELNRIRKEVMIQEKEQVEAEKKIAGEQK